MRVIPIVDVDRCTKIGTLLLLRNSVPVFLGFFIQSTQMFTFLLFTNAGSIIAYETKKTSICERIHYQFTIFVILSRV